MDIFILFFTFLYRLFVFQLTSTNDIWFFLFFFYSLLLCIILSLSPLATYRFPKFDDDSTALNMYY